MYGVGLSLRLGSGKAKCQMCHELIGKNQPCIYIELNWKQKGYIHGMATECTRMIEGFKLKV